LAPTNSSITVRAFYRHANCIDRFATAKDLQYLSKNVWAEMLLVTEMVGALLDEVFHGSSIASERIVP